MVYKRSILLGLMISSLALMAFSCPPEAVQRSGGIPWWVWVIIILLLAILIGWLLSRDSGAEEKVSAPKPEMVTRSHAVEMATPEVEEPAPVVEEEQEKEEEEAEPPPPDDLKLVEGIGPKISSLLAAAGITTFAQLADTEVSRLVEIVRGAGITIADPTTWPDQAGLAAAGKWGELEALQGDLKGGRRA